MKSLIACLITSALAFVLFGCETRLDGDAPHFPQGTGLTVLNDERLAYWGTTVGGQWKVIVVYDASLICPEDMRLVELGSGPGTSGSGRHEYTAHPFGELGIIPKDQQGKAKYRDVLIHSVSVSYKVESDSNYAELKIPNSTIDSVDLTKGRLVYFRVEKDKSITLVKQLWPASFTDDADSEKIEQYLRSNGLKYGS